jgi:hypothetical protein
MKTKKLLILLMLAPLFAVNANAAPVMGYSVNSDSASDEQDSLFQIDLSNSTDEYIGRLIPNPDIQRDTEGLAFDADNVLWGIDDLTLTLFRINTESGAILFQDERTLKGLPTPPLGGHDFGMTFSCDNTLYIASVYADTLYELDLEGNSVAIGKLGAPISAIAAIGTPTRLYGLGNGLDKDGKLNSPYLYRIDAETGAAEQIGTLGLGDAASAYNQAGLAFDSEGKLWAITDRRGVNGSKDGMPSQILRIDTEYGTATRVGETSEVGFESLAIAAPTDCLAAGSRIDDAEPLPTLGGTGRLFTIFILMFSGLVILRRRLF